MSCCLEKLNAVRTNTYAATITEMIVPAILADSWSPITIVNAPTARAAHSADTENAKLLAHFNPGRASSALGAISPSLGIRRGINLAFGG